ncbi:VLRF1 family aeRF1-type release factor [Priestia endophytica]|uniref:VLRF1 family aeRF1-type release factor n=1 Tax=Priestia endophytica TaxID=135735 RepID=UPI000DCA817E|nr:VLRF1 family aeRF1-type release factor [Priestia endophytica]RAS88342.1 hypothetical protein A4U60_00660 [Priestia endophytica]
MSLNKVFNKLEHVKTQAPDKILTLYINTDRRDQDQQGGEYKIALKTGFKRLEEYMKRSDEEEQKRVCALREKVEGYIRDQERKMPRSFVIFASCDSEIWEVLSLQIPVETNFHWEEYPVLEPLQRLYETYPNTGIVLLQQTEVKIIDTKLSKVQGVKHYHYDLDIDDWRLHEGPSKADINMGGGANVASQKDEFQERVTANHKRFWKSMGSKLDKIAADNKWTSILLVGDKEIAKTIEGNMNKKIDEMIEKNLLNEEENKVVQELLKTS